MKLTQHACYAEQLKRMSTLAEFFLVGFTLIVLSISNCSWSTSLKSVKFSLFWNLFCYIALISDSKVDQLQLLMNNTIKVKPTKKNSASVARLEGLLRRLMYKLHIKRTKLPKI
jgi:hypothetical protein